VRAWPRRLGYVVLPLTALVWQVARAWGEPPHRRLDFRIYHEAVRAASDGGLYDFRDPILGLGFTYPPFAAVLLRPFSTLGVVTAEKLWLLVAAAMTIAFAALCTALLPGTRAAWQQTLACTFFVVAMPVSLTLRLGQVNALIALLVVCDALLLSRRSRWAGAATGIATAVKLTPGFVVLAFALAGRIRLAATALAAATAATLVGALVFFDGTRTYVTDVVFDTERVGSPEDTLNNSLRRPIAWVTPGDPWETLLWGAAGIAVLALVVRRVRSSLRRGDTLTAVAMASIGSALVSPITWGHHLMFLAPAIAIVALTGRVWWRWLVVLPGVLVAIDPFEGGEGPASPVWRIVVMLALLVVPLDATRQQASTTLRAMSGTFVTSPSTPSDTSAAMRRGSSTVQTLTARPAACAAATSDSSTVGSKGCSAR
jgi:alpha-1,2-mannosyltransferase